MFVFITLGIFVLSVVLNILRMYYVRKRGYFFTHKSQRYEKFENELNKMLE